MSRLQDFPTVTPTSSDNLLIVQSGGQGLASIGSTLGAKMDKSNPTGTGSLSINRKSGTATGSQSDAVGYNTTASGDQSFAEGHSTVASGNQSHAEGYQTTASNSRSHAEGSGTTASGSRSHAEGEGTTASGSWSHAENINTKASGDRSHCEGYQTEATRRSQHVFGEFNTKDTSGADSTAKGAYIEIVGNGSNDANRSNARTLDWSGNEVLAGGLKLHGNQDASTLTVTSAIAGGSTYDFTNFSDGAVIFVYRPSDSGQSDYTGIYIRAGNWQRLIPIKEAPNVTINGYVLTNGNTQALRCVVIST